MSGECEEITVEEVKEAVKKSKTGKAPGPSGVLGEMLKAAGDVGIQWIHDRLVQCSGIGGKDS